MKTIARKINAFLAYVDSYFTGGVVPKVNGAYYLSGETMGTPTSAGLISRQSIIDKYTAAGKTCTITVRS